MNIQIEPLSSDDLRKYFIEAKIFNNPYFFNERINKLSANACFVTVRNNEKIIALIAYYMNIKPLCYITHLSVLESFRRRGIATRMLHYLEKEALSKGFSLMKLEVKKDNYQALNLYQQNHFTILENNNNSGYYMEKQL